MNQLLKHYDWDRSKAASGGVGMLWQIFPGRDRKSKKQVSIFLIQKKSIPRVGRDELWEKVIKKDASILTKLRHPHVLDVKRAPCEDRSALVFVTEPVVCSLANLLGDTRGIEGPQEKETKEVVPGAAAEGKDGKGNGSTSLQLPAHLANVQITHLDVKNGLRQLVECLEFLHTSGRLIHGHVSPCNIYLTPSGHWKLAGDKRGSVSPRRRRHKRLCLEDDRRDSKQSSKGLVIGVAYHLCKFIAKKQHSPKPVASIDEYRAWIGSLHRPLILDSIPKTLRKYLARMLAVDPTHRASLKGFLSSEYYNDVLVRTLRYLDGLLQTDLKTRVQFLRQLPKVINLFDARNAEMKVMHSVDKEGGVGVWTQLIDGPSKADAPVEGGRKATDVVYVAGYFEVCGKDAEKIVRREDRSGFAKGVSDKNATVRLCASSAIAPCGFGVQRKSSAGLSILPKIQRLAKGPGPAEVRAGALNAIGNLFELFDKVTVKELIIPAVNDAIKFGRSAILLRAAIRLYSSLGKAMGANITATTLLPMVTPLLMESCLSKADVANLLEITQTMLSSVGRLRLAQLILSMMMNNDTDTTITTMNDGNNDDGDTTPTTMEGDVNDDALFQEVDASGLTAALDDSGDVGNGVDLGWKGAGAEGMEWNLRNLLGSTCQGVCDQTNTGRTGRQTKLPARVTSQNQQSSTTTTTQASNDGTSDAFNFLSGGGGGPTTNISNADDIFGDLMSGSTGSTKNNGNSSNPLHHQRNGMGGNSSSSKHSSSRGGSSSASALDDPFGDFGFGGGNDRSRNSNNAAMNKHSSSNKMVRSGGAGGEGGGGEASVISKMTKRGSSGSVSRGTSVGFMGGTTNSSNLMGGMIGAGSSGGMDDFLGGFAAGTRTAPGSMGGNGGGGDVLDFLETGNSGFNKVVGTMGQNSGVAPGSSGAENDILDFLN
eukprot:jgi/Bigna1/86123/estExt_fgenesh1_pg.C_80135